MDKKIKLSSLYGEDNVRSLENKKVMIIGLGGVGSYAAEAISRSFVGNIVVMDSDVFDESNVNRQLHCDVDTIGKTKASVIGQNAQKINPDVKLTILEERLTVENIPEIVTEDIDYVIDAIDDTHVKICLIKYCYDNGIKIITSCGTANKKHPEMLTIDDLYSTSFCPLARKLRKELGKLGVKKLPVVYSKEEVTIADDTDRSFLGSSAFVPGTAGLILASYVINSITVDK